MLKRILATALVLLATAAGTADAQYFGRNKVQYDQFRFAVLDTPHFQIHYYPSEREAAQIAARLAERWYARLSTRLHHTFDRPQPIILYASHSHFSETTILPGSVPEGVGGFTDHLAGRVVLPFAAGLGETDHVLGHEIVHAFQRDILRKQGRSIGLLPLWFTEGMAEYLSLDAIDVNTRMWLRDAVISKHLPTIAQLDDPKWFPYRYGQALWAFLAATHGDDIVVRALNVRRSRKAVDRLEQTTGTRAAELSKAWHQFIEHTVGEVGTETTIAGARRVIGGTPDSGRLNVGPALSPDGRWIVFLSERDGYAVDVFVADAATGAVVRKLLSTATDAHFDSLQFIESSGAWSADGRRFVLATVRDGRPVLTIFDMPEGSVRQTIVVPTIDEIFTPAWSPDGQRIAFTGLKGGLTDLYVIATADGRVEPLTNDGYSDLQPAWSPDGTRIAFTTDRFTSSIDALEFGDYQLASIDAASREVTFLGGITGGKSIDPQWSDDGRAVYFVADATGVANVYRLDLDSARVSMLTDVAVGVSGVTALSPSISLGEHGGTLAMTVYGDGAYQIHLLELDTAAPPLSTRAAILPRPPAVAPQAVSATRFPGRDYEPRLSLFSLGQPYMSAGGGPFGTYLRAGVSLGLTDLLGEQEVQGSIQVGRRMADLAGEVSYINRRRRWNWGVQASQVPWQVGASQTVATVTTAAGDPIVIRDSNLEQQRHRQGSGVLVYPFSRARRIEISAGVDAVRFDRQITRATFSPSTLERLDQNTFSQRSGENATSFISGAAFVHDTAVFGVTSPIMGERYRFGINSSFGDLAWTSASADYRRYLRPFGPLTIATRVQYVARLGRDVTDDRLLPLVWSPREIVRGFDQDPITSRASQLAAANAEARVPLASLFGRPATSQLPLEIFTFADAGRFLAPHRGGLPAAVRDLASVGAGARINAAGFVFELNAVHALTLLDGWRVAVNFRPGF